MHIDGVLKFQATASYSEPGPTLRLIEKMPRKDEGGGDGGSTALTIIMKGAELAMDWALRVIGPILVTRAAHLVEKKNLLIAHYSRCR